MGKPATDGAAARQAQRQRCEGGAAEGPGRGLKAAPGVVRFQFDFVRVANMAEPQAVSEICGIGWRRQVRLIGSMNVAFSQKGPSDDRRRADVTFALAAFGSRPRSDGQVGP